MREKDQTPLSSHILASDNQNAIYHGRHTDESSISIFGENGGVLTRVDDSMAQPSGVAFGDRLGYIWFAECENMIWCFGCGCDGIIGTGDRPPFCDQFDDGDWRCGATVAAATAAAAWAFIWFGDWIWMDGRNCVLIGALIALAPYACCRCRLFVGVLRSMWFMQLFKCLMIGVDVSWSTTFKKLVTSAAQWRNPALNFSA